MERILDVLRQRKTSAVGQNLLVKMGEIQEILNRMPERKEDLVRSDGCFGSGGEVSGRIDGAEVDEEERGRSRFGGSVWKSRKESWMLLKDESRQNECKKPSFS